MAPKPKPRMVKPNCLLYIMRVELKISKSKRENNLHSQRKINLHSKRAIVTKVCQAQIVVSITVELAEG